MAMINPETVSESFVAWLESQNIATFNTDLYLNQVPDEAPDRCFWVLTSGGAPIQKLRTGEQVQEYYCSVYMRSTKGKEIEKELFKLAQLLNQPSCLQLEGFETIEVEASQFPTQTDFDSEDRRVGMLQANINIYKKEQ